MKKKSQKKYSLYSRTFSRIFFRNFSFFLIIYIDFDIIRDISE